MSDTPTWSPQQAAALDKVGAWLADPNAPQVFPMFGYAGTGKTTLAKHLAYTGARWPLFAAFTGKAASVLRERGCHNATTLHSLLYNVRDRDKARLKELEEVVLLTEVSEAETRLDDPDFLHPDLPELRAELALERDKVKRPWFHVNEDSVIRQCDLLVVDEVSMVDEKIGKDIEYFGKKILVLGDPAQLPPVRGGGYFTERRPEVLLTEIHRQALDNPILQWATLARQQKLIPYGDLGLAKKFRRDVIDDFWLSKAGQILVGKNETRHDLNRRIRKVLGRERPTPEHGDKLVMLQNDHKLGILNGTLGLCQGQALQDEHDPDTLWMNIYYDKRIMGNMKVDANPFYGRECNDRKRLAVDYGYALTVHKAQGSQWKNVVVYDDGFAKREGGEARARWLYTAITRAEHQLYILTS